MGEQQQGQQIQYVLPQGAEQQQIQYVVKQGAEQQQVQYVLQQGAEQQQVTYAPPPPVLYVQGGQVIQAPQLQIAQQGQVVGQAQQVQLAQPGQVVTYGAPTSMQAQAAFGAPMVSSGVVGVGSRVTVPNEIFAK